MEPQSFLTIDEQPISLTKALSYLRATGDLQLFILKIIRQYLLESELQTRNDIKVETHLIEQAIIDFRLENQLTEPDQFQKWLQIQGISYQEFHNQITAKLKIEKLKTEVTALKLKSYFEANKPLLDKVVLSRIVVNDFNLSLSIKNQVLEESSKFEHLAKVHSFTDNGLVNGLLGLVSLGEIPEQIRETIANSSPGELIGPVEINRGYALLRVEQFIPASLEGALKRELQEQLFDQWLQEKAQKMTIKIHID